MQQQAQYKSHTFDEIDSFSQRLYPMTLNLMKIQLLKLTSRQRLITKLQALNLLAYFSCSFGVQYLILSQILPRYSLNNNCASFPFHLYHYLFLLHDDLDFLTI